MEGLCLNCGKPIKKGSRADSKFCSDECRTSHHNKGKLEESREIKIIQLALKHNRRILKQLLGKQAEVLVKKEVLMQKGFDFNYHTHHVTSKVKAREYTFTFNYGYTIMPNGEFKIVKSFR